MSNSYTRQFGGDDDDEIRTLEQIGWHNLTAAQKYRLEYLYNTRGGGYRKRKLMKSKKYKKSKKSKRYKKITRRR